MYDILLTIYWINAYYVTEVCSLHKMYMEIGGLGVLNEIMKQIVAILVQIATIIGGGYLICYIRAKMKQEKFRNYFACSKTVVTAIQHSLGVGREPDKKKETIQLLNKMTQQKIQKEQREKIIEAAVCKMNEKIKN